MAEVSAGMHRVAAPATVINLFAVGPFNDISYHVIAFSVDLMHKTSSASFGPNNWLMVTYQSLNAFGDWRNHPSFEMRPTVSKNRAFINYSLRVLFY